MRWTGRLVAILLVVVPSTVLVLVLAAMPARAAFPGRNGLLVVEPAGGKGLLLVGPDGAHPRQICKVSARCDGARDPIWSPDGSEIAFAKPDSNALGGLVPYVIYSDGSCLACAVPVPADDGTFSSWAPNLGPGFLPRGRLAVATEAYSLVPGALNAPALQLGAMNFDGIGFQPFAVSGSWQQLAWSPTGRLAAVRRVGRSPEVFAIDPRTGSARQVTGDGARSPAWSPDGRRLAVVHDGWIELVGSGGGRVRRLTRGGRPAWAPNGKELAFVGAHDRLFVIATRGGRPRPVGHIRAARVDWQPVPRQPPRPCQAPAGSRVAAASPDATVVIDPGTVQQGIDFQAPAFTVLGCLMSDGRMRLLENLPPSSYDGAVGVGDVVVAGDYAALINETGEDHYTFDSSAEVAVYDLRTGNAVADRGGEGAFCPFAGLDPSCQKMDQLVLGADGITAVHRFGHNCTPPSLCTTVEEIVVSDSTGQHTLDSITDPDNSTQSLLSQLALSGHTLTWSHAGSPRSAQLN